MTPQRRKRKLARWFNKRGRISCWESIFWGFRPSGNLWVEEDYQHSWKRITPEKHRHIKAMLREMEGPRTRYRLGDTYRNHFE